ncbi:hypothetical protein HUK65_03850 [Rhodobacteraceae bacterium 2376]|uniref:Uncharacterized protein n=1 Tax=Rhabdonatronobacter sediminivivens TaxID=2743469 RepID=A0A7Z0HXR5_9RHOB|nr:hypothetical protein [Rhabdonatronobacter sediminivivens]NYS24115.1 hypothetical protein [Rhabdonatronobacter sediminivivens]
MFYLVDILVGFSALAAAAYCLVLSRRLRALTRIDGTVGGAVAVLSSQVDSMTRALDHARRASSESQKGLSEQTERAEAAVRRLELLMVSLQAAPESRSGPSSVTPADTAQVQAALTSPAPLGGSIFGPSAVAPRQGNGAFWRDTATHPTPATDTPEQADPAPKPRSRPRILRHRRTRGAA